MKYLPGILSIVLFSLCIPDNVLGQDLNYREVFGEYWTKAGEYERENRYWMEEMADENQVPYETVIAIIFPELVRYSALRDRMETTLLKALYINLGEEYANFSIGRFQVKPSFAEKIRDDANELLDRKSEISFMQKEDFNDISNYRKSIVTDLEDPRTEFRYVIAFIRICEKKYKTERMTEPEKVKFLSTAYNYGIEGDAEEIMRMSESRYFTTSLLKSERYCYADVSLFWFRNNRIRPLASNFLRR
ncbi:MAG TPA: hypothetical protein VK213_07720 [Bacteroidales bacterium]|nr:hypothetical protein [Bacteroidales bacterium]